LFKLLQAGCDEHSATSDLVFAQTEGISIR